MTTSDRWNELQARWAAGEPLSPEEERERHDGADTDALAARELAMFEDLRARGEGIEELPRGLVDRVLAAVGSRPRLHLLAPGERPAAAARSPRLRRVALVAAAIAVPLAAAAAAVLVLRSRPEPAPSGTAAPFAPAPLARSELVLASGEVTAPGDARVGGRPLAAGDSVSTGDGRACLGIDPGIDVCLGGESQIVVESLRTDDIRIRVERGTALAALSHREAGHTFALTAGDSAVRARGTVFAVERQGADALDVVVMEGAVEVAGGAGPAAIVSAHSRLAVRRGSERGPAEAIGRGEEARFWALLAARGLWAKPELGVLEVRAGEPGLEIAVDREAPLTLPFHAFVPAGRRSLSLRTAAGDELSSSVDVVAGETLVVDPRDLMARRALSDEAAVVPSAASLLARARNELASGNTRAALGVYERLRSTYPTSPEARTVLVTIGKLELDLKQPARALKSFDAYLGAPGPLAPEALAGKIRALRALGRTADERRAIETYLSRHPDGFESPLLRQRLEVLQGR
jgi:hypothetical protein